MRYQYIQQYSIQQYKEQFAFSSTLMLQHTIIYYKFQEIVMGGHGGLNILPQKKWNVYNYDNRGIVDKDKKLAAKKKKDEYQKNRDKRLGEKMQLLTGDKQIQKYKQIKQKKDLTVPSLPTKSINLFAKEQHIINAGQLSEYKKQISDKHLKDQGVQEIGISLTAGKLPWYARKKGEIQQKQQKNNRNWESVEAKKTNSYAISQYAQIQGKKVKNLEMERERSREKPLKHEHSYQVKIQAHDKTEIQRLRQKRLKREKKQRERTIKLLGK